MMTRFKILCLFSCLSWLGLPVLAGPRSSTNYVVSTDAVGTGFARSGSANYTSDGSAGGSVAGVSTITAPAGTAKHGYIAQLSEVVSLQLSATPVTVNESDSRQLGATILLDDLTTGVASPTEITWSVASGPLSQVSAGGLATAATVYQDETAEVQGGYAGVTASLGLTVVNTQTDNFGSYGGDGIDDDWQVVFFGEDNPDAGPDRDPDGDEQTNLFEFTAGLDPGDPHSFFHFHIEPVPGAPDQMKLIFSPVIAGRNYMVTATSVLGVPMQPLTGVTVSDDGNVRTVIDDQAGGGAKFYRVEIEMP